MTPAYSPEANGRIERLNSSLMRKVRAMLHGGGFSKDFWGEALHTAAVIYNISPHSALPPNTTPYERMCGVKPNLSGLRPFGCLAFAHVPAHMRDKLDPQARVCKMLGYETHSRAYRLYEISTGSVIVSRDVRFVETKFPHIKPMHALLKSSTLRDTEWQDPDSPAFDIVDTDSSEEEEIMTAYHRGRVVTSRTSASPSTTVTPPHTTAQPDTITGEEEQSTNDLFIEEEHNNNEHIDEIERPESPDPLTMHVDFIVRQQHKVLAPVFLAVDNTEPTTWQQAMRAPDADKWQAAMDDELKSLHDNGTWTMVPRPRDRKVIGVRWVFRIKPATAQQPEPRYKARLVVKGYSQVAGIDFNDTFAPTLNMTSLRTLITVSAREGMYIEMMDVATAFLNADIDADIYVEQPPGYEDNTGLVCKLNKSLYGIRQAPHLWSKTLAAAIKDLGFRASTADDCVFVMDDSKYGKAYLAVYVDDLVLASKSRQLMDNVQDQLCSRFKTRRLGAIATCIGIDFKRDNSNKNVFHLSQRRYINTILTRFGMQDCKPVGTPVDMSAPKLTKATEHEPLADNTEYRRIIGSLMYAAVATRPDIAAQVSVLSKHLERPADRHMAAAKRVLRYLKGTIDMTLELGKRAIVDNDKMLVGYADADWAGDIDTRRSTSGYLFTVCDSTVSWRSTLQKTLATSSTNAEYIATSTATRELVWMQHYLDQLGFKQGPTILYNDNLGSIANINGDHGLCHKSNKHIDVHYHYAREKVQEGIMQVKYLETSKMLADLLTKGLVRAKLTPLIKGIGMVNTKGKVQLEEEC